MDSVSLLHPLCESLHYTCDTNVLCSSSWSVLQVMTINVSHSLVEASWYWQLPPSTVVCTLAWGKRSHLTWLPKCHRFIGNHTIAFCRWLWLHSLMGRRPTCMDLGLQCYRWRKCCYRCLLGPWSLLGVLDYIGQPTGVVWQFCIVL